MPKEKKKSKKCTAQSVAKTNLKTERIENYAERQIGYLIPLRKYQKKYSSLFKP